MIVERGDRRIRIRRAAAAPRPTGSVRDEREERTGKCTHLRKRSDARLRLWALPHAATPAHRRLTRRTQPAATDITRYAAQLRTGLSAEAEAEAEAEAWIWGTWRQDNAERSGAEFWWGAHARRLRRSMHEWRREETGTNTRTSWRCCTRRWRAKVWVRRDTRTSN